MKELNWDGQNDYGWSESGNVLGEVAGYGHGLIPERTEENSKTSDIVHCYTAFNFYPLTMKGSFMLSS